MPSPRLLRWAAIAFIATPALALTTDPASVPAPAPQPGDTWVYDHTTERGTTGFTQRRVDVAIERVTADAMFVGVKPDGAPTSYEDHVTGLDWSQRRLVDGHETVTTRPFAFPLEVGKTWASDFVDPNQHGLQTSAHIRATYKVVGWVDVVVPAGTFHALKIQSEGVVDAQVAPAVAAASAAVVTSSGATTVAHTGKAPARVIHNVTYSELYYVPSLKYYVKNVHELYNAENVRVLRETDALVSYKIAS